MKKLVLNISFLLVCSTVFCQAKMYDPDALLKKFGSEKRIILNPYHIQKDLLQDAKLSDTARYQYSAAKGHIYSLPNSNMPCLKPFESTPLLNSLPGSKPVPSTITGELQPTIPNALAPKTLVFEAPKPEQPANRQP